MNRIAFCLILIFFWYQAIIAQNEFTSYVPNTLAVGYGGSQVTYTDNPSIVYWNPGGIAFTTTDRILTNISSSPSYLNYITFTKFFPPQNSIGVSLLRITLEEESFLDVATVAYSFRINNFLSIGGNFNYGGYNKNDEDFASVGIGCLLQPGINRDSFYQTGNSPFYLFVNPALYEKFALGIMIHNLAFDRFSTMHKIRFGSAFKFSKWGPILNLDYHINRGKNSSHFGFGFNLTSYLSIFTGTTNFDDNNLAFGSSISLKAFNAAFVYSAQSEKITVSLSMRLKKDASLLAKKYKEQGTKKIREGYLRGALHDYEKSLAYEQNNERLIYLTSVLNKRINRITLKIDSLFVEAVRFQRKRWFIYATIIYKKILEIDKYNERAKNGIQSIKAHLAYDINALYKEGVKDYNNNKLDNAKSKFKYILLVKDNHRGALKYLVKIDSVTSHLSNEYYYRGLGYYKQRRLEKSKNSFQKVLEMNAKHKEAKYYIKKINQELIANQKLINRLYEKALSLEKRGNYVLASTKYQKILEINRDHKKAAQQLDLLQAYIDVIVSRKYNRAKNLYNKGDFQEAQTAFRDVLSIKPSYRQARQYLNKIKNTHSDKIDRNFEQARRYFYDRRWNDALNELDKVLAIYPDHQEAQKMQRNIYSYISLDELQNKGLRLFKQGVYLNALKVFNQIIAKDPGNVIAKSYVSECRAKLGKRISELFNSGMSFYTAGNYEAAIREWNRILGIDPNHKSALEYKKRAQERLEALKKLP